MPKLKDQDDISSMMAAFESQDAMMTPFLMSFEKLKEVINRAEHEGVCSEEVAETARQEIEDLRFKMDLLVLKKIKLRQRFGVSENAST